MKNKSYLILLLITGFVYGCGDNSTSPDPSTDEPCIDEEAGVEYPCENVELLAHVGLEEFQGDSLRLNDIWGWTDPATGKEYALVGLIDGVSFVDISNPEAPVVVGKLEESIEAGTGEGRNKRRMHDDHEAKSAWRDFKVFEDHLFVVSDGQPHGLQVFNLTRLRDVENPPVLFSEDVWYDEFDNAHNIAINEESGYAYVVGSNSFGGGLHIINIQDPLNPQFAGFHSDSTVGHDSTGYVHDTQCVIYQGSDDAYQGEELCFNSSETHLAIANVTDKENTYTVSKAAYEGVAYAHQGWLTEDQRYFLLNDELDERQQNHNTRTIIWDLNSLEDPEVIGFYEAETPSIDHNLYVKGNYVYEANYTSGLRILNLDEVHEGQLQEVGYFDTFPQSNAVEFDGAWSNYPFFESGVVIVSDISNGLFVVQPHL